MEHATGARPTSTITGSSEVVAPLAAGSKAVAFLRTDGPEYVVVPDAQACVVVHIILLYFGIYLLLKSERYPQKVKWFSTGCNEMHFDQYIFASLRPEPYNLIS